MDPYHVLCRVGAVAYELELPHPLVSILSSMYHFFVLMMPQVMPVGSCPLTLSLLRDSLSLK